MQKKIKYITSLTQSFKHKLQISHSFGSLKTRRVFYVNHSELLMTIKQKLTPYKHCLRLFIAFNVIGVCSPLPNLSIRRQNLKNYYNFTFLIYLRFRRSKDFRLSLKYDVWTHITVRRAYLLISKTFDTTSLW